MTDAPGGPSLQLDLAKYARGLEYMNLFKESGRVRKVLGPVVEGTLPGASIGGICRILHQTGRSIDAEIVGFRDRTALLMPLGPLEGINMGARIEQSAETATVVVRPEMIGTLVNAQGDIVERVSEPGINIAGYKEERRLVKGAALLPSERRSIKERLDTGVRAIDTTLPIGVGQRLAIMAASGVGKSVLMGMIAKQSKADINIIALIGERGREVTEFLERDLGPEGMKRTIVVACTSDESPVLRARAAFVATTIAEYFRDYGANVLLMMDSVTRFGMALREIGLATGEPPTTKGYTPSVFSITPKLLERAGAKKGAGSITGLYTVLVEGNDFDDPIADHVRSVVDGHIVLSRDLAAKSHYPAIDILPSISRLASSIASPRDLDLNGQIRSVLATYRSAEDLINIGGYRKGNNPEWDRAIAIYPKLIEFLRQKTEEGTTLSDCRERLEEIFRG